MLRALICLVLSATASAFTIGVLPQRPACAATRADSPVMMPKFLKDLCVLSRTHEPSHLRGSHSASTCNGTRAGSPIWTSLTTR